MQRTKNQYRLPLKELYEEKILALLTDHFNEYIQHFYLVKEVQVFRNNGKALKELYVVKLNVALVEFKARGLSILQIKANFSILSLWIT